MAKSRASDEWRRFPASARAHEAPERAEPRTPFEADVRESGRAPDVPAGRRHWACWHHENAATCAAKLERLSFDQRVRREIAIGLETLMWLHVRRSLDGDIPHRAFLERYDPSRRWNGGTPLFGLARAAIYYHLPLDGDGRTVAERFQESALASRICAAERAWLKAELEARFSFFWVSDLSPTTVRLNDSFPGLGGRSVVLPYEEIDLDDVGPCHTVFARIVTWRGAPFVDLMQYETTVRMRTPDPTSPARYVAQAGIDVSDPAAFVRLLFQAWEHETGPFQAKGR